MRDLNVRTNLIAVGDKPAKLVKLTVTDNGTYTPTYPIEGYDEVEVEIPEPVLDEVTFTENGTYTPEHDGFSEVTVEVPEPAPVILESLTATENGTYDPADYMADGFSDVTVNVPSGGSGSADFYLIDPVTLNTPSGSSSHSKVNIASSPYIINWQDSYNDFATVNEGTIKSVIRGSNSVRTFYTKIPKNAKRIEISGRNDTSASYTYLCFYILAGPDPSPNGIYGGSFNCTVIHTFHFAEYSGWTTEQLNSQTYLTRTGQGPKKIDQQVLVIDIESMVNDNIITDDFWLGASCCDMDFVIDYIKVVMSQSSETDDSNINYYMSGSNFGAGCYITNGHFLHFTTSGYPNYQITNSSGQRLYYDLSDFEMCLTIKCNTFTVSRDQRLCCNGYDDAYSPMLVLASNGKIWAGISTNSGNNLNTTCTLAADGTRATKLTEGWCKIKIGFKNRVYTLTFIDKDGNIETTSTDASNNPYSNTSYGYGFQLGDRSSSNSCPDVVIDLSKSYYKQGNTYVWGHAQ